ncbi:hypothetical protein FGADI_13382 [Fusarium gaditjirri]|uniref:Uncharacterized protein n=1 Tax=Fusarium gaditjirri TaxID=282569 RepID=A0A8H4SPS8_9HYPO|nr:hypothetical protein FGADI_13382 [Fusarium gaditjirri]
MGTQGLWAFRYGGKYYVFWNEYDSDELGETIANGVPRGSSQFQAWMDEKRGDCEVLKQRLDCAWLISPDSGGMSELLSEIAGSEDLFIAPGYVRPHCDLFLEHIVVVDLDRELLDCNGVCFFFLAQLPQTSIHALLKPANLYWLGLDIEPKHPCITTDTVLAPPHDNEELIASKYRTLSPRLKVPLFHMATAMTASQALVSSMTQAFALVSQMYGRAITQARDTCFETDYLFREVSYLLLSMASCSPDRVRLANAEWLEWPTTAHESLGHLSVAKYGILGDDGDAQPRELVSTFLSDFHEACKTPGSSPYTTSYWMGPVFVWLTRDLLSRSSFEAAIYAAVTEARAVPGKREFPVVVFSIRHFVLVRVTPTVVFHSKRFALWTEPATVDMLFLDTEHVDFPFRRPDWVSDNCQRSFEELAHFFISTSPHSEAFRELGKLAMDRELTIVNQLEGEPDLLQFPGQDEIEQRGLFSQLNRANVIDGQARCILVIRASCSSRTSSMLTVPVLWERWANPLPVKTDVVKTDVQLPLSDGFANAELEGFKREYLYRLSTNKPIWRQAFEEAGINWELLEKVLSSLYERRIVSRARGLAVLYALIFFIPKGIGGCGVHQDSYFNNIDRTYRSQIPRQRLGAHLQIASRIRPDASYRSVYFLALFKPVSEDTSEGWKRAESEAHAQAAVEYFRQAFQFWINNDAPLLHVTNHPQIPTMEEVPPEASFNIEKARQWSYHKPSWRYCDAMKPYLDHARSELRFGDVEVDDISDDDMPLDTKARRPPLDTRTKEDRPAITAALSWARQLADLHGDQETEELVHPDLYLWP